MSTSRYIRLKAKYKNKERSGPPKPAISSSVYTEQTTLPAPGHDQVGHDPFPAPDTPDIVSPDPTPKPEPEASPEQIPNPEPGKEEKIVLNPGQQSALEMMKGNKNIFLTGDAGTGKSTVVREFVNQTNKNLAILAPTGIAALNIGGQTIHSFFQLSFGIQQPENLDDLSTKKEKIIRAIDTFLIDEISMVRSDILNAINHRLQACAKKKDKNKIFGGKKIICIGDFAQLPPVVKEDEKEYLNDMYSGPYAFNSNAWNFDSVKLDQVMRTNDPEFLAALNLIRKGQNQGLDIINTRLGVQEPKNTIILATTNRVANSINHSKLSKVKGKKYSYQAEKWGKVPAIPGEESLTLKKGARVVFIANGYDNRVLLYANGDTGTVTKCDRENIEVKLDRNSKKIELKKHTWESISYNYDPGKKELKKEIIGGFKQYPLRLGSALTVHKSQGMTLPNVKIDLQRHCFAHGQLYVALSRSTGLKNLFLSQKILPKNLIIDPKIIDFFEKNNL